jgi:beta-mannosidase
LEKYFGKANSLEEVIERGQLLQAEGLKAIYEGARRQKPYCSMALNWSFNEPWPTAANSSIISWPDVPKPSFYAVSESCRPFMLSAEMEKFVWKRGEEFRARLWVLNDRPFTSDPLEAKVTIRTGDVETEIYTWKAEGTGENQNLRGAEVKCILPETKDSQFLLKIHCPEFPAYSSSYTLLFQKNELNN